MNPSFSTWFVPYREQFIADIVDLVNIPTVSTVTGDPNAPFGPGCKEILSHIRNICERKGFSFTNHENYCGTVLWKGEISDELGIFHHLDVVPEGTGWTYPPYQATQIDGCIIGRGTNDNKAPAMAALYALYYLKESGFKPRHSIRMYFGLNEESGMADIDYYLSRNPMPVFAFSPDSPSWPVCYAEKGILNLTITSPCDSRVLLDFQAGVNNNSVPDRAYAVLAVPYSQAAAALSDADVMLESYEDGRCKVSASGVACHAAFPENSISAEQKLASILCNSGLLDPDAFRVMDAIRTFFFDYYGEGLHIACNDPNMGRLTHIGGSVKTEDGAIMQTINIRYPVSAEKLNLHDTIERRATQFGFRISEYRDNKPSYMDPTMPEIREMTRICNEKLGTDLKPYTMGGGTYARKLKRAVAYGPFMDSDTNQFGPDRGRGHQVDEYASIDSLIRAADIIAEAVQALDDIIH